MNTHQLTAQLVKAGIDPSSVAVRVDGRVRRLAAARHPGLRPITSAQIQVLVSRGLGPVTRTGALVSAVSTDPSLAHVFPGWNVWAVDQVKDLPFDPLMVGVDREAQLRIWVEDAVRLGAPGATVADPIALKGSQIQILADAPTGLPVFQHKEQVPGDPMLTDGESSLRYVRFFNRGEASDLPWPHDDSYILDQILTPSPGSAATSGPGPGTITSHVVDPATDVLKTALTIVTVAAVSVLGFQVLQARRRTA